MAAAQALRGLFQHTQKYVTKIFSKFSLDFQCHNQSKVGRQRSDRDHPPQQPVTGHLVPKDYIPRPARMVSRGSREKSTFFFGKFEFPALAKQTREIQIHISARWYKMSGIRF